MDRTTAIAVFDFDETIVFENSLGLLFQHATGSRTYFLHAIPAILSFLFTSQAYQSGAYYQLRKAIKQRLYRHCLQGRSMATLESAGKFAATKLTLNPGVVEHLKQHRQQGDYILIATASPWQYVEAILSAQNIPFDKVIGTELSIASSASDNAALRGQINGEECSRDHKWQRIQETLIGAGFKPESLTAFGNDPDDIPMLRQATLGYIVSGTDITAYQGN
ncbi:MAG: haloacid dehalogenase-like hydrolase [Pseudomonadales bacterium]|uniref:HAD family hydrolase n=1 Tax=Oleiphilus messinensis TaxID=141451 RepID=A0A1Y0I2J5_9GAMM|nr:HAD-IB family phosphatase [Oleiphilus messinensis]ARU54692.1 HAD family hydrolase [Oleiphilus messinensis]MCG8611500.1 haloacid dehalogenase-like hydrolase [Pseudomonadales bacterium]